MKLEGIGPSKKLFEDIPDGNYQFRIVSPKDWLRKIEDKDENNQPDGAYATYINWTLEVITPEEHAGRKFFHSTMIDANEAKIAKARAPYDPQGFTYQFLVNIGAATLKEGVANVKPEFLDDDDLNLDALIGLEFWGTKSTRKDKNGKDQPNLEKAWVA